MVLRFYPALIERAADGGGFGVVFPDLPGCVSAGATVQEAAANAAEALALHIEGMAEDGDPIPEPSAPDAPLPDWLAEQPDGGGDVRAARGGGEVSPLGHQRDAALRRGL